MDEEIERDLKEIEAVREEIQKVQHEINKVKEQIVSVEQKLNEHGLSVEDTAYWRTEELQLMEEENVLNDLKNKLHDMKNKFLDKENKLLDDANELKKEERGVASELLRGLKRQLEHFQEQQLGQPTPLETPSSLGHKTICELKEALLLSRLDDCVDPSQPAVLDASLLERLSCLHNEHQVAAFMTSIFREILQEHLHIQVVNSEEYGWLQTFSTSSWYHQKPDHIFCHEAICNSRRPFKTQDPELISLRSPSDKYGLLADWALRDCIDVVGEATIEITNAAFGEVVNYARHICFGKGAPKHAKLLLYDKTEFWLIRATKGEISSVEIYQLGAAGSRRKLANFLSGGRSPWIRLLVSACNYWKLKVQTDAFLGKGTFGRVFRVSQMQEGRSRVVALKIVLPGDRGTRTLELLKEKEAQERAGEVLASGVARVEGFYDFGELGSAMLLEDVGGEVPQEAWRRLFETLGFLHERNVVHGDPRLSNAIYAEGSVRWIDFRPSVVANSNASLYSKKRDLNILVQSCYFELKTSMPPVMSKALEQYSGTIASALIVYEVLLREGTQHRDP